MTQPGTKEEDMRTQRNIGILVVTLLLLLLPLQAQYGGRLKINNATYGRNGQGANVTSQVRHMMRNNALDFKVNNNNLGGDPNKGADKILRISYTYQGATRVAQFKEGERCRLP
jgi:hypothetical protein